MATRNKQEKEKAEWQLALDLQEKKMMEGMQDICNKMSDKLKKIFHMKLEDIKKDLGDLRKDIQEVTQKIQVLECSQAKSDTKIQHLKD